MKFLDAEILLTGLHDIATQFQIFVAHERVKSVGDALIQCLDADKFLHVRQVFQARKAGHPRRQFQFNQFRQINRLHTINDDGMSLGIRKLDRLRLAIPRILAADDDLNGDVLFGLTELLGRPRECWPIPAADQTRAGTSPSLLPTSAGQCPR